MIFKISVVLIILVLAYFARIWMTKSYSHICPNCNYKFKPEPLQLMATFHLSGKHYLKCPNCGKRALMEQVYDRTEQE